MAEHLVDGAAVDSLIWDYMNRIDPQMTSKTKVIVKSPPYAVPPFVAYPRLDPKLRKDIKEVLLNANLDPEGKKILANMMIDKFIEGNDSDYDSIREMESWIKKNGP